MNELILQIKGPIAGLLSEMYSKQIFNKKLFITSERNYHTLTADLKKLIKKGYVSLTRKGQTAELKILAKGQKEIKK